MNKKKTGIISSYKYFAYQNIDLINRLEESLDPGEIFFNLNEFKESAETECTAYFLGYLSKYDSTFLKYAYIFKNVEYGFAWETFYDERHRAYSSENENVWYDNIKQGDSIEILINRSFPERHYITGSIFQKMNDNVIFLGTYNTQI